MEQIRTEVPEFSETEIAQTFETLSLETQQQRDVILEQQHWVGEPRDSDARYIIVLSNSSKPAPAVG